MEITKKRSKKNRKAFVLPLATLMVILLLTVGIALLKLGTIARMQAAQTTAKISARTSADAGVTQAVRLMNEKLAEAVWDNSNMPAQTTSLSLSNSYGSFTYNIAGNPSNGFTITSTGKSGIAEEKVYCKLGVKSSWFGIGVKGGVNINLGANLSTIPADSDFIVRTNSIADGAVTLKTGVVIPGDVVVGPGGDPDEVIDTKSSTVIEGSTYTAGEDICFPPVIAPPIASVLVIAPDVNGVDTISGSGWFSGSLTISDEVRIKGEHTIYFTGNLILENSAKLVLTAGSTLDLYLGGNMEAKNGSQIITEITPPATAPDATRLKIYGLPGCTSINLKNSSDFYGYIYAPDADLTVFNSGDVTGAFVGNSFDLKNSGNFIFDTRLATGDIDSEAAYFGKRWWE